MKKIVLMGNPNVGKSLLFSRLTGTKVVTSNFPGTTVGITRGTFSCTHLNCNEHQYMLIDAPGAYSFSNQKEHADIEKVARKITETADIIINVVDATSLERNLLLTLELIKCHKGPLIMALNLWDEAKYHGISIDIKELSNILGIPVIPTIALTGNGVKELATTVTNFPDLKDRIVINDSIDWDIIKNIENRVQTKITRKKRLHEYWESITLDPIWGTLIAIAILIICFSAIFFIADYIENFIEIILQYCYTPLLLGLYKLLNGFPFLQTILVGTTDGLTINYSEAMGLLTSGLYIPLAKVAPPVGIFYAIIGLLEDSGYLPRLATLSDTVMHRFALHGFAIVPLILGAGCNVTGILATRLLPNRAQRIIASFLLSIAIPCTSQIAMIVRMGGRMGVKYMFVIFACLFLIWYSVGYFLGMHQTKSYDELILELPPYRIPDMKMVFKKLYYRMYNFFGDAIPVTIGGIFILLVCNYFHLLDGLANFLGIFSQKLWGLPSTVVPVILMGLFRKEIALSFLDRHSELTNAQLCVTTLLLSISFACLSVYTILYKEFGGRVLFYMVAAMCGIATLMGFLLSSILVYI